MMQKAESLPLLGSASPTIVYDSSARQPSEFNLNMHASVAACGAHGARAGPPAHKDASHVGWQQVSLRCAETALVVLRTAPRCDDLADLSWTSHPAIGGSSRPAFSKVKRL